MGKNKTACLQDVKYLSPGVWAFRCPQMFPWAGECVPLPAGSWGSELHPWPTHIFKHWWSNMLFRCTAGSVVGDWNGAPWMAESSHVIWVVVPKDETSENNIQQPLWGCRCSMESKWHYCESVCVLIVGKMQYTALMAPPKESANNHCRGPRWWRSWPFPHAPPCNPFTAWDMHQNWRQHWLSWHQYKGVHSHPSMAQSPREWTTLRWLDHTQINYLLGF